MISVTCWMMKYIISYIVKHLLEKGWNYLRYWIKAYRKMKTTFLVLFNLWFDNKIIDIKITKALSRFLEETQK